MCFTVGIKGINSATSNFWAISNLGDLSLKEPSIFLRTKKSIEISAQSVLLRLIKKRTRDARGFIDLGCDDNGNYSKQVMNQFGFTGIGISEVPIRACFQELAAEIESGDYFLLQDDLARARGSKFDFGLTWVNKKKLGNKKMFLSDCINSIKPSGQYYFVLPRSQLDAVAALIELMQETGFKNIELVVSGQSSLRYLISVSNYLGSQGENVLSACIFKVCRSFFDKLVLQPLILLENSFLEEAARMLIVVADR